MYLRRERQILVLQIEALCRENQQAEADLETLYKLHQQEIHSLREESLQVREETDCSRYCSDLNSSSIYI